MARTPVDLEIVEADPRDPEALACLGRYYEELAQRIPAGFDVARSRDPRPSALRRPHGTFLVARVDDGASGCVALCGTGTPIAEIKRLWVAPEARGHGIAGRLMQRAEAVAAELGIATLRLDTHGSLIEARALYGRTGWREVARFNDDPYAEVFFEKDVASILRSAEHER